MSCTYFLEKRKGFGISSHGLTLEGSDPHEFPLYSYESDLFGKFDHCVSFSIIQTNFQRDFSDGVSIFACPQNHIEERRLWNPDSKALMNKFSLGKIAAPSGGCFLNDDWYFMHLITIGLFLQLLIWNWFSLPNLARRAPLPFTI